MEKEQIFKTNKVILIMHSIISAIMIVGLVYELTQPTFNAVTFVIRWCLFWDLMWWGLFCLSGIRQKIFTAGAAVLDLVWCMRFTCF